MSKKPEDVRILTDLQGKLAKRKKIGVFDEEYFKKQLAEPFASLYIVRYKEEEESRPIAAVLVFEGEKTR